MTDRNDRVVEEEPDSDYMLKEDVDRNIVWLYEETLEIDRLADLKELPELREISAAEYPGDEGEGPYARPDAAPPEGGG
jgi:hypothetical protein